MGKIVLGEGGRWSVANLRIFSETLQPKEIDAALGVKATRTHIRGQSRSPDHKIAWKESLWLFQSPLGRNRELADHLIYLLDLFEPKSEIIKSLSKQYHVDFHCGFSSGHGQGGFVLESGTLMRIAGFGVPFIVNLYPPALDEEQIGEQPL